MRYYREYRVPGMAENVPLKKPDRPRAKKWMASTSEEGEQRSY